MQPLNSILDVAVPEVREEPVHKSQPVSPEQVSVAASPTPIPEATPAPEPEVKPTAKPAESVTSSGTIDSTTSGTTTNDLTDTTTDNLTESTSNTANNSRSYNDKTTEFSVSGAAETEAAFRKYIQPYDYLAREIVNTICELFW